MPASDSQAFLRERDKHDAERQEVPATGCRRARATERIHHGGGTGHATGLGKDSAPPAWRLAAVNMAIGGTGFHFGMELADTAMRGSGSRNFAA